VYAKLSGVVTEAGYPDWTEAALQPYLDTVLDAFGPGRFMFGSDWPVCLVATSYSGWLGLVRKQIERLSEAERDRVLRGTAIEAYRLTTSSPLP
jgi:L-fuconolactonase